MAKCSIGCLNLSPVSLLVYFCLLNILMYIDRGAVASLVTAFEDDPNLKLTNFQAGIVGSVFMFGFMIASPIFANASQSVHAFTLITVGVTIWAGSCLLAGVSNSFGLLVAARALSGIGEASFVCLASPIILSKAPADKKNLWISIFYSALTIGYALGYVIAPPIKNGFGGWQYVFFLEMIASAPFILIALFAYRDPTLVFKKDKKVSIMVQFKELSKNTVYCYMVLGYGAFTFTVGGLAFWGPTILQKQYGKSETVASMSLGLITIFSGLVATVLGSVILEKMLKQHRLEFQDGRISQKKFSYYITEKSNKLITRVGIGCLIIGLTGAIFAPTLPGSKGGAPFGFFLLCLCISEFLLFLGVGPSNMGIMNTVDVDMRPQAVAVSIFMMHLLGDFPSPFLIGVLNESVSMYFGTIVLMGWMVFCCMFWGIAFGVAVRFIKRFHGAPSEYVKSHFCSRNVIKQEDDRRLITADNEEPRDDYHQPSNEKSVNRLREDELY